jgi:curved DNA-binding protein CbpA
MSEDPFGALGLPARAGLSDEDVRAAWRRVAAATHPDRDDGGDPSRFSAAAAAYDTLRTSFGRGEALADLGLAGAAPYAGRGAARRAGRGAARHARRTGGLAPRVSGRGWRLALRACAAAGVTAAALLGAGWTPATIGVLTGVLTWVAVTCRGDLPGRGDGLPARRAKTRDTKTRDTECPSGGSKYPAFCPGGRR